MDEFTILATLRSPFVVYFYGICVEPQMSLVMEYCCNGSVYEVLNRKVNFIFPTPFLYCSVFYDQNRILFLIGAYL